MSSSVRPRSLLAALGLLFLNAAAQAQVVPKTIRLVVAYPSGGVSDVVARALADKLAAQLGSTLVVENRAGASGTIGMDAVAKAAPDGATLGFSAISPLVLSPHLGRLPFDPLKDVAPVASVMYSPVLLMATSATGTRDLQSLLDDARARPGAVRWATSGQASLGHIVLEQLRGAAKVDITHIPYKGGGQQLNDAIGGQFEVLSTNAGPSISAQIQAGKLRPLAVGAPARLENLPRVPTLAELGFAAANLSSQFGVFAPAGTPAILIEKYNVEINKALASPDLRARLLATDNVPTGGSIDSFAAEIRTEYENNGRVVRSAGIKAE
ncbi:tripartite tricarboxylate transporter substrate binding protein [Variovorax sp. J22P168]|uniref:Bug family tripartite tricarboxylate transporter substrate binding protein n=1 Tax=Variovorax jilinensis TaxID=3053513 RepID=UPI002577ABB2|nr:tripartite tricarboxylate transporter substrate binding protein [Variovorax sp. J22P168]MDM0012996.1 tripartite tricarboxylate transporter substrate binding protein [Variovorax sp. J22P168]